MNKKLLSLVMSGAMLVSACPAGVSAVPTGFKDSVKGSVVNAVKFVKNHKPAFAVGGTVIGTTVVAGAIAWLYYHNRDIVLDFNDQSFNTKLSDALASPANRVVVKGVKGKDEFQRKLDSAKAKNVEYDANGLNDLNDNDKKTVIITKKVEKGQIKLTFEVKVEAETEEEKNKGKTLQQSVSDSQAEIKVEAETEEESLSKSLEAIIQKLSLNKEESINNISAKYIDSMLKRLIALGKDVEISNGEISDGEGYDYYSVNRYYVIPPPSFVKDERCYHFDFTGDTIYYNMNKDIDGLFKQLDINKSSKGKLTLIKVEYNDKGENKEKLRIKFEPSHE